MNNPLTWERLAELAKAEAEGRIIILPYEPGTTFKQDESGEYDIVLTGKALYETKCNEDTEWLNSKEIQDLARRHKRRGNHAED
jgi:hypothetical protein